MPTRPGPTSSSQLSLPSGDVKNVAAKMTSITPKLDPEHGNRRQPYWSPSPCAAGRGPG
jgi:hypothetical protein